MNLPRSVFCAVFMAALLIYTPHLLHAFELPKEPELPDLLTETGDDLDVIKEVRYNSDILFFYVEFDLDKDGDVDYITARHIMRFIAIVEKTEIFDKTAPPEKFGNPAPPEYERLIVETKPYPLFYWYKPKGEKIFQQWIDPEEDGVNGNEKPYEVYKNPYENKRFH